MITMEQMAARGLGWLTRSWQRLTEPAMEALRERRATRQGAPESRWSLAAFRLSLSHRGLAFSRLMGGAAQPIQQEEVALYEEPGRLRRLTAIRPADPLSQTQDRQDSWSAPACRVDLSQAGLVASGALSSLHAAPGELDRFVEQIRQGRRAGYYQPEVFEQARALLRQNELVTPRSPLLAG